MAVTPRGRGRWYLLCRERLHTLLDLRLRGVGLAAVEVRDEEPDEE